MEKVDYTRHYKKWHTDTPEYLNYIVTFNKKIVSPYLPIKRESKILEIGCGTGNMLLALRELGYDKIEGIEIDEGQAKACMQKGLNVKKVDNSTEFLINNSNSYDLVLLFDVLEHIRQEEQLPFLISLCNSLRTGGKLICTVPNANSALSARWRYIDWTHFISFTEHSLDFVLYNAGFKQIEVKEMEFFSRPVGRLFFTRSIFSKEFRKRLKQWYLFKFFRKVQRLKMIAELGYEQGEKVPLSLNLMAIATKNE